jgi:hypothetical protein
MEMVTWFRQYYSNFQVGFYSEKQLLTVRFTVKEKKIDEWEILENRGELSEKFIGAGLTLGQLFEELKKEGCTRARVPLWPRTDTVAAEDDRVQTFFIPKSAFDAESMPFDEFAQAVVNSYSLGTARGNISGG